MNAHALLSAQGWRGHGHSLHKTDDSIGLAKPLLLSRKDNTKGLGVAQHFNNDQWWLNAFDEQLKGLETSASGGGVKQTVTTGKLNIIEKGSQGKWSVYSSFVRGGFLEGTLSLLKKAEEEKEKEKEKEDSTTTSSSSSSTSESETKVSSKKSEDKKEKQKKKDGSKSSKKDNETKEERRARKEAKRQRKLDRALRREAKRQARKSKRQGLGSSSEGSDALDEEKKRRREKKEEKRRKRAKEGKSSKK